MSWHEGQPPYRESERGRENRNLTEYIKQSAIARREESAWVRYQRDFADYSGVRGPVGVRDDPTQRLNYIPAPDPPDEDLAQREADEALARRLQREEEETTARERVATAVPFVWTHSQEDLEAIQAAIRNPRTGRSFWTGIRRLKKITVKPRLSIQLKDKPLEANTCAICMTEPKEVTFVPCGHSDFCFNCGVNDALKKCPVCRDEIEQVIGRFVNS